MSVIAPGFVAGLSPLTSTNPDHFNVGIDPRQHGGYALNSSDALADMWNSSPGATLPVFVSNPDLDVVAGTAFHIAPTQHTDYHFRLWVLPNILKLTNPGFGISFSFKLWNTWSDPETIASIVVVGSNVITFNIGPGTELHDFEYRSASLQLSAGEATIEATATFNTESLSGLLTIIALVSDTFNLIPDVPVTERWIFLTDALTNRFGVEQRIALRNYPRIEQNFDVEIIDLAERRQQYELLWRNMRVQAYVPLYQYATYLTAPTASGLTKLFFDPARTNIRVGEFLVLVQPSSSIASLHSVVSADADGATLDSGSGQDIDRTWMVVPTMLTSINDGSGIEMDSVTGTLRIKSKSQLEPTLLRPLATRTLSTLNGVPLLDRRPLVSARENMEFEREIIDNETGQRSFSTSWQHVKISGERRFTIQRINDPDEMDYWRSFFDTIKGSWKSFLLSTYFPDLTPFTPVIQGSSTIVVNEGYYADLYFPYETWKHIEFEFPGGEISQHLVSSAIFNLDNTATLSFTPPLTDDPAYVNPTRISYLNRVKASDKVVLTHFANYSEISFGITGSDE